MKDKSAPRIAAGPHPTGETQALRGFTGVQKSKDANGNEVRRFYLRGHQCAPERIGARA